MSKFNDAISEIENMSQMAQKDQWVNNMHPLVKLFLTILYIVLVVSFNRYNLSGVFAMIVYPIFAFIICDLSWKEAFYRLRVVLPLVCIIGLFNPLFDTAIITYIPGPGGPIAVSAGVMSMITIIVKGVFTVLASYILIATTTIEKICYALRLIHVPKILVTEIMLIYRYITVLLGEAKRITQAYSLRAPGQKGVHYKVWGSLVGQFLIRSMDKADIVYESMCLRGYNGEFSFVEKSSITGTDIIYLCVWTAIFIGFRVFPIISIVGGLFG